MCLRYYQINPLPICGVGSWMEDTAFAFFLKDLKLILPFLFSLFHQMAQLARTNSKQRSGGLYYLEADCWYIVSNIWTYKCPSLTVMHILWWLDIGHVNHNYVSRESGCTQILSTLSSFSISFFSLTVSVMHYSSLITEHKYYYEWKANIFQWDKI